MAPDRLYQRSISDLAKLFAIKKPEDIKSVILVDDYVDDNIPSAIIKVNGVKYDLPWCGSSVIGALEYVKDSPKAKKKVVSALKNAIEVDIECDCFDFTDEDLIKVITKYREQYELIVDYIRSHRANSTLRKLAASYFENSKVINTKLEILV